ncbi:uncharacterized protein EDB93DRAFT_1103799 [Suillus bovinus]|uniref:uncharacterized protein n=1 Tax=Suillus bovinus TaxID=48563 RepID=UPI001B8845D7|nr:uncharacterized protein EDB93DRAFT_1103799 [Suillus bovinus]KAG2148757.1 hypothetical protein EDB93DRAFT_1103799 [Suillus bovinus]
MGLVKDRLLLRRCPKATSTQQESLHYADGRDKEGAPRDVVIGLVKDRLPLRRCLKATSTQQESLHYADGRDKEGAPRDVVIGLVKDRLPLRRCPKATSTQQESLHYADGRDKEGAPRDVVMGLVKDRLPLRRCPKATSTQQESLHYADGRGKRSAERRGDRACQRQVAIEAMSQSHTVEEKEAPRDVVIGLVKDRLPLRRCPKATSTQQESLHYADGRGKRSAERRGDRACQRQVAIEAMSQSHRKPSRDVVTGFVKDKSPLRRWPGATMQTAEKEEGVVTGHISKTGCHRGDIPEPTS